MNKLQVGTMPIGNLKDITVRMIEAIEQADYILCESIETFKSQCLEAGWKTNAKLIEYTYYDTSTQYVLEKEEIYNIAINALKNNQNVLVVSEYGSMFIEDPGSHLFHMIRSSELEITVLPGPSIVTTAYVASGMDSSTNAKDDRIRGSFIFQPFYMIPKNEDKYKQILDLKDSFRTMVFIDKFLNLSFLLQTIDEIFGERGIAILSNLTQDSEKIYLGKTKDAIEYFTGLQNRVLQTHEKTEITIVCEGKNLHDTI